MTLRTSWLLVLTLGACGGGTGASDAGGTMMDAALADASRSDAGSALDAGSDAFVLDAFVLDAFVIDASPDGGAALDSGGPCTGTAQTACNVPEDCAPVGCTCSCSGCGGVDYQDVVNIACTAAYYAQRGCARPDICLDVCCPMTTITCVDHVCGATRGATG